MSAPDHDPLLDHEYDGIRELDNPMPGWWKATFLASVVFSALYLWFYQGLGQDLVADEYAADVARYLEHQEALAAKAEIVSEETLTELSHDAAAVAEARAKFGAVCAPCHGARGEGKIGPNLTDEFWLNGDGSLMSILSTVEGGVVAKGMPAWGRQLAPDEVKKMAAFVGSIRNTHQAGGKKGEGQRARAL